LEELKEGISYEDPLDVFESNIFFIEKELKIQITSDFPVLKLFWYFEQFKKLYMKNGKKS